MAFPSNEYPPGDGIPQLLFEAVRLLSERTRARYAGLRLHEALARILERVTREEGVTQTQLADALRYAMPSLTKQLQRLESEGWIERRTDQYDYRVVRIHPTDRARALMSGISSDLAQIERRIFSNVSTDEATILRSLVERLREDIEALRQEQQADD